MEKLTLLLLVVFSLVLTVKDTPKVIYNDLKKDLSNRDIKINNQWSEIIRMAELHPKLYGVSLDFGAHGDQVGVHILVNKPLWGTFSKNQKKLLILHESFHSLFSIKHCKDTLCVMSGGEIERMRKLDYNTMLEYSLKHHDIK